MASARPKKAKLSEIDDAALQSLRAEVEDKLAAVYTNIEYCSSELAKVRAEVKDYKLALNSLERDLAGARGDIHHLERRCETLPATQAVHMNLITALEERCGAIETALSRPLFARAVAPADGKPAAMNVG